jgi:predicted small secreted protein
MKDLAIMLSIKVAVIGLVVYIVMLTGCSTVAGAGKDITGAAEWTKKQMEPGVKLDSSK